MSKSFPIIIRDPIHNIIPFEDNIIDRLLFDLINTTEFQRLRRIKQLGMCDLVFPGANHTRFAHSIGVMHIARRMIESLNRKLRDENKITDQHKIVVLCAALLHDIGHGPFSHAFEVVTGIDHEKRSLDIISDPSTCIYKSLEKVENDLPAKIVSFFDTSEDTENPIVPIFLTHIVSSQLDADRFDYLLRDSYMTGTQYGNFDLDWIIEHLQVDLDKNHLFLEHKSLYTVEEYIFARRHMYQTVYYHKAIRSAEVMLKLLFERYKELVRSSEKENQSQVVPNIPSEIVNAFASADITLSDYLALDDYCLTMFFKACRNSEDEILKRLGTGLTDRILYKGIDLSRHDALEIGNFTPEVHEMLKSRGIQTEDNKYYFHPDAPSDKSYKLYNPDAERPAEQIYVKNKKGEIVEFSQESEPTRTLTNETKLIRYYFPETISCDIIKITGSVLGGE